MNESETGYVYTLSDPRVGEPRYVGRTTEPEQRYHGHLNRPHSEGLRDWIGELREEGVEPEMSLVRVCPVAEMRQEERRVLYQIAAEFDVLNMRIPVSYPMMPKNTQHAVNTADPDSRDRAVLNAFDGKRVNGTLLQERTGLDKDDVGTAIDRLCRFGHVRKVTHGLYRITEAGKRERDQHTRGPSGDPDR